jgi:hypothetical protein
MREETFKEAFRDFYYYFNENDPSDKNNTFEKKFYNPHTSMGNRNSYTFDSDNSSSTGTHTGDKAISNSNVDNKFSKIKIMSNSNNNSLLRHYRQPSAISNNSTLSSNYNQRSSISPNL